MKKMWLDTSERYGVKRDPPRKCLGKEKECSCPEEWWGRQRSREVVMSASVFKQEDRLLSNTLLLQEKQSVIKNKQRKLAVAKAHILSSKEPRVSAPRQCSARFVFESVFLPSSSTHSSEWLRWHTVQGSSHTMCRADHRVCKTDDGHRWPWRTWCRAAGSNVWTVPTVASLLAAGHMEELCKVLC